MLYARYVITNREGKIADHVCRIAVQCFHLLLILLLDLIVIFLKIKLSVVDTDVSNGQEVAPKL